MAVRKTKLTRQQGIWWAHQDLNLGPKDY